MVTQFVVVGQPRNQMSQQNQGYVPVGTVLPPDRNLRPGFNIINGQLIEVRAPTHLQHNQINQSASRMPQNTYINRNFVSQKKSQQQSNASWESTLSTLSEPVRDDFKMNNFKYRDDFKAKPNKAPKICKAKLIWDPIGSYFYDLFNYDFIFANFEF